MPKNFQNRTWFISGASGLVGSNIISKLIETDVEIIAMVRESTDPEKIKWLTDRKIKVFIGDLLDILSFKYQLGTCDVVVHTAASVQDQNHKHTWNVNLEGTKNIIKAMLEFKVERIIHISTVGVYGISSDIPIDENQIPNPIGNYSKSKYAAELELLKHEDQLKITMFRPPYIIGNMDRHVIPKLHKLLNKRFIPKIWKKNPKFGFVHARDIASATLIAGSLDNTPSNIYNIQSFTLSFNELIDFGELLYNKKIIGVPIPIHVITVVSLFIDVITKFTPWKTEMTKRLRTIRKDWIFSTQRIERELDWFSQYNDKNKIFVLLSHYDIDGVTSEINGTLENINSPME